MSAEGRWLQKLILGKQDNLLGELYAIELALKLAPGALTILSDAKPALGWIARPGTAATRTQAEAARRIRVAMQRRDIELVWLKGHTGHRLHDAADRLARAALIPREPAVARQVAEQIITDQLETATA